MRLNVNEIFEKYNTDEDFTFEEFVKPKYSGGHNKWITRYPKTNTVFKILKESFDNGEIGYNWVTDHFGGNVAEFSLGITQIEANSIKKHDSISWDDFVSKYASIFNSEGLDYFLTKEEWNQYAKPKVRSYITVKNIPHLINATELTKIVTNGHFFGKVDSFDTKKLLQNKDFIEFLETKASFRTLSNTQLAIYTDGSGIFTREGKIRINNPKEVGEFVCIISFDELNYGRDLDDVDNLWAWRCSRNEIRGKYEEHFGYDVKHMSHLFRLLLGAIDILKIGTYKPRLQGENLEFVRKVLRGEFDYDSMIDYADELEIKLNEAYCLSKLPEKPDFDAANKLLLKLSL
jgi:hypothetical protein